MTKLLAGLMLIGLIVVSGCKNADNNNNDSINKKEVLNSETTITEKQLVGSWLDQSDSKLHFTLLENGDARSDNMKTLLYQKWRLEGTKLIMTAESIGNHTSSVGDETYEIKSLTEDKMVLQDGDRSLEFVKKK